jgi:hypothetical protein
MIPTTIDRHARHTHRRVNDCISEHTRDNVARYASASPQLLDQRLQELAREWDVERVTAAAAGLGLAAGLILTLVAGLWWLLVPAAIASCLLLHAVAGWSPVLPLIRRLGYRTGCEIAHERYALKALRGDFQRLDAVTTPQEREDLARFEDEGGPPAPEPKPDAGDPHIVNEAIRAAQA